MFHRRARSAMIARSQLFSTPSRAPGFLSVERITAKEEDSKKPFTRIKQVFPSVAAHLCLGAPFAWSLFVAPLSHELGVVTAAHSDWSLPSIVPVISVVFAMQGISAAVLGKFMENLSPRANGLMAACAFGGGFALAGLGVHLHSLPLLYMGYGFFGGIGIGLGYVPAVKNLMGWFPDRVGFASGVTICGFGGAALAAAPAADWLMKRFASPPKFLGSDIAVSTTSSGARVAIDPSTGQTVDVVLANAKDLATLHFADLQEGVYVVGSGSTGVAATMMTFGAVYFSVLAAASMMYRVAPSGFAPAGWKRPVLASGAVQTYVPVENVMKTPQFWMGFTMLGCLATSGLAVASVAKTLMLDIFRPGLPALVTAGFASGYVMSLSIANLSGRLIWSSVSDLIGRKNMFAIMTFGSIPLYLAMSQLTSFNNSVTAMACFYGASLLSFSFFGASYSMMPALEADLFGKKAITATHGRMLLASSLAAVTGPSVIVALRHRSEMAAIHDLASKCDLIKFQETFGAPISALDQLIASKSVTISKLLSILPSDTIDPSSFMYNDTLYFSAGLMTVAGIATLMLRPVAAKFLVVDHGDKSASLPASKIERTILVCVDDSAASKSAYAWALAQAKPGKDMMMPIAVVPLKIQEVPKLLHPFVQAAKEKGVFVTPLFCPSNNLGEALTAVILAKNPNVVVLGKRDGRSQLAAHLIERIRTPIVALVEESPDWTIREYDQLQVRNNVDWNELKSGELYEAKSKHNK